MSVSLKIEIPGSFYWFPYIEYDRRLCYEMDNGEYRELRRWQRTLRWLWLEVVIVGGIAYHLDWGICQCKACKKWEAYQTPTAQSAPDRE